MGRVLLIIFVGNNFLIILSKKRINPFNPNIFKYVFSKTKIDVYAGIISNLYQTLYRDIYYLISTLQKMYPF